jgi:hypothetical protein
MASTKHAPVVNLMFSLNLWNPYWKRGSKEASPNTAAYADYLSTIRLTSDFNLMSFDRRDWKCSKSLARKHKSGARKHTSSPLRTVRRRCRCGRPIGAPAVPASGDSSRRLPEAQHHSSTNRTWVHQHVRARACTCCLSPLSILPRCIYPVGG